MSKGVLIVVSAPAGCGKDTLLEQAMKRDSNFYYSVSATSRAMRPGEENGVSYFFETKESFRKMIDEGMLLEYTEYCGNYYGTPKKNVTDNLDAGRDVILKIEVEGAGNIKKQFPDALSIFIIPPSFAELERRLRKRGTETDDVIKMRLETAKKELLSAYSYDYIITNGELSDAVDDFLSVVRSYKLKKERRTEDIDALLK